MTEINPRTTSIALILAGAIIISAAISSYAYVAVNMYAYRDSFLTSIVTGVIIIGLALALLGVFLYFWDRSHYWKHKRFSVNY
jgi:xanthine/uracil permease